MRGLIWFGVACAVLASLAVGGGAVGGSKAPAPGAPLPGSPPPPVGGRAAVVAAALSQVGLGDPAPYWASAAPGVHVQAGIDWCGGFALWALHQAGLALDWTWQFGLGFLMTAKHKLPQTKSPQPGDIAYFDHNQHHAVVQAVGDGFVDLINGNGEHGLVSTSSVDTSKVTAFFSIAPLLAGNA